MSEKAMAPMNINIENLRRLHAATTHGKWGVWGFAGDNHRTVGIKRYAATFVTVAQKLSVYKEDAQFIATAHEIFPTLLDEIERIRIAVEHAEYMAAAVDRFFSADNEWQQAVMDHEEEGSDETGDSINATLQSRSEAWRALESAVYEFRKRAARARI